MAENMEISCRRHPCGLCDGAQHTRAIRQPLPDRNHALTQSG